MTAAYEWLASASSWWWPRFADHLWQTTLFALVILAASLVLKRGPAHWRHTLCLLASAKFIVPAALVVFLAQQTGIGSRLGFAEPDDQSALLLSGISVPVTTLASNYDVTVSSTTTVSKKFYAALSAVWLAGSGLILLRWAVRRQRLVRSLRAGRNLKRGREWEALKKAQESLLLTRKVELIVSPLKIEPGVWRIWRPVVVLPESMATLLDDDELEAIMLHEVIHIQRSDNLVGLLQSGLCALLWFHPLVWFIRRKVFDEREQACDERVVEVCEAPGAYASSILKVVRFCVGWRVAGVTGAASGSNLRRRIENIMSGENTIRRASRTSRLLATALVSLASFVLLILVAAGVYNHPLAASAAAKEKGASAGSGNEQASSAEPITDKRSSRKAKPGPPPPSPPSPRTPATPSASAAPAVPPQPAQPAVPAQPPAPDQPEMQDSDKQDKDKSWKESKEKVKKGELIEAPKPAYPDEVKKQKIEGMVAVVITIGRDGNVIYAKAKSGPEELYGVSEAAALKARFKPTILEGNPVKVTGIMTYDFVLDKE